MSASMWAMTGIIALLSSWPPKPRTVPQEMVFVAYMQVSMSQFWHFASATCISPRPTAVMQ